MENIKLGPYRHFKGNIYEVIGVAAHAETSEIGVVYRNGPPRMSRLMWFRPIEMFLEEVEHEGRMVPRFEYIGETLE